MDADVRMGDRCGLCETIYHKSCSPDACFSGSQTSISGSILVRRKRDITESRTGEAGTNACAKTASLASYAAACGAA